MGYRPTWEQLVEILELAQKGIEANPFAHIKYSQGDEEIYSHGDSGQISRGNLEEVIKEAGDPEELNNLYFSISQDSPVRKIEIQIGYGEWTTYLVESDDQTWAYGRYHELTDKLLANRGLFANGYSPSPQVLQEGTDDKWRRAAWEIVSDWKTSIAGHLITALWYVLIVELVLLGYTLGTYYDPGGNTRASKNDQHNAAIILSWADKNSFIIFCINLSYVATIVALRRWIKSLLKSVVVLQDGPFLAQLSLQRNRNDPIRLATLYITFSALIVSVVALITR